MPDYLDYYFLTDFCSNIVIKFLIEVVALIYYD